MGEINSWWKIKRLDERKSWEGFCRRLPSCRYYWRFLPPLFFHPSDTPWLFPPSAVSLHPKAKSRNRRQSRTHRSTTTIGSRKPPPHSPGGKRGRWRRRRREQGQRKKQRNKKKTKKRVECWRWLSSRALNCKGLGGGMKKEAAAIGGGGGQARTGVQAGRGDVRRLLFARAF